MPEETNSQPVAETPVESSVESQPAIDWEAKAKEWESKYAEADKKLSEYNFMDKWLTDTQGSEKSEPTLVAHEWETEKQTLLQELESLRAFQNEYTSKQEKEAEAYVAEHFSDLFESDEAVTKWAAMIDAGLDLNEAADIVRSKYLKPKEDPTPDYYQGAAATGQGDSPQTLGKRAKPKSIFDWMSEAYDDAERQLAKR